MSTLAAALVAAVGLMSAGAAEFTAAEGYAPLSHPGTRVRVFVSDTTRAAAPSGETSREPDAPKNSRLIATLFEFRDHAIVVRRNAHGGLVGAGLGAVTGSLFHSEE